MSSWVALNIEPDEAIEEEVDDTKEIQIEEALKLYQNALKLHSQGPPFYDEAAEAYDALLNSEIFKYPESLSDSKRNALQDTDLQLGGDEIAGDTAAEPLVEFDINDSTSSTLMQTIYLSYKNHGQYTLDSLRASIEDASHSDESAQEISATIADRVNKALSSFAEALERDDTDLNLWRQSARLCSALQSYRLARYCLESVLADDENRLEVRAEQLGLEETLTEEHLRETLLSLEDRISAAQVPLRKPKKTLLKFLKPQSDPYPYLPALPNTLQNADPTKHPLRSRLPDHEVKLSVLTWAAVGKAILRVHGDEVQGDDVPTGSRIIFSLPALSPEMKAITTRESSAQDQSSKSRDEVDADSRKDAHVAEGDDRSAAQNTAPVKLEAPDEQTDDHSSIDQRAEKQLMESLEVQSSHSPEIQNRPEHTNADEIEIKSSSAPRKRSSASAITEDQAERIRAKSRRTRLRESNAEASLQAEDIVFDQSKYYEDQLEIYTQADEWVFNTTNSLLSKIGIEDLAGIEELRKCLSSLNDDKDSPISGANESECSLHQDLINALKHWDEGKAQAVLQGDYFSAFRDIQGMGKSGLAVFLEHSRKSARKLGIKQVLAGVEELIHLLNIVNDGSFNIHNVAFDWLKCLLMPEYGNFPAAHAPDAPSFPVMKSTYTLFQWPSDLKETVVQVLLSEDEYIYKRMLDHVQDLERQIISTAVGSQFTYTSNHFAHLEMIETIFELQLDIYSSINNPNSEVNTGGRILQRDRLDRWCSLARTALTHFMDHAPSGGHQKSMLLRHIWTSTFHSNMTTDAHREHILLCLEELQRLLECLDNPLIGLVNNAAMPEISLEIIDQEISKLKSMDFFLKIFSPNSRDPVDIIETIEPLLEPSSVGFTEEDSSGGQELAGPSSQLQEMGSFLDRGDATLRLFLWRRLQVAYTDIDYPPKVVSCFLRSIEVIIKELWSSAHLQEPSEHRQVTLLRWLKMFDGILTKTVTMVLRDPAKAYDCFDMDHLKSSMSAIALLTKLLHGLILYEDSVRVGQTSRPELRGSLAKSLESFKDRLRETYVRCWILQYTLLKEAIAQNKDIFGTPLDDCIHYLRAVHHALGIRKMCKRSHKEFLKLMKSELLAPDDKEDYELDICQVLYDIHGIKLSTVDNYLLDHGCPPEKLDRATAIMMIDFVMKQAKKMNIKDLSKSELKHTIEKMQQAIGNTRSSGPLNYNKRILTTYLKSPLNPSGIFRSVRGVEDLTLLPIPLSIESAVIARNGWYFLLGYTALTKFRSQKRLNPVPTNDLDEAVSWFRSDLEHGTARWETWYRLAQTYDSKVEEDITWSAEKINNNRTELVTWQRYAIHCYAMAVSTAIRNAEPTPETRALLSELYTDFGIRLYSSSRAPLSMGAFSLSDFTRHYNREENQQMYETQPFKEMRLYSVWNLASYLLKRAIVDKPKSWMTHYMYAKCLWKMFSADETVRGGAKSISLDDLLDSLLDAIDALPQKKDSRAEPIFEPHFKLVSIVHKLVHRGTLTAAEGSKTLLATPWARKVQPPEDEASWKTYTLAVIRNLRHADKSNWHHRMALRAAHIIYDDSKDAESAARAKGELTQQIFTKTMTIQVWKPEYERPGRHFVYTTRYVYFFVALLDQLNDRANLDQLLRRVRKKQGDFINHTKLWEDVCLTYARVIRRAGNISEGHEEGVFRPIGWEEFVLNTARLDDLQQLAPESGSLLELLRDAIELKKLNNNLMKVSLLEDLIADLYSRLYEVNMSLVLEQANEENKEKMKVDHLLMGSDGAAETPTPPTSAPASEAPAPRGRTKGIARRDIQKRAETIVNRKLAPRLPTGKAPAPVESSDPSQNHHQTEPASSSITSAPRQSKDLAARAPATATRGTAEDPTSGQQSDMAHSVHDSADDESELSEIDDEKLSKLASDRKLMFPNLERGSLDPESEMSALEGDGDGDITIEPVGDADLGEGEGETMVEGDDVDDGEGEGDGEEGEGDDEPDVEADEEGAADVDMENEGEGDGEDEHDLEGEGEGEEEEEGEGEGDDTVEMDGVEPETEQPDASELVSEAEPMDV
ncbi:putative transcriptional corepressor of histone genes (Hir3) [Aspergillus affinis]|uniref:putative transcriptional corepressor of histone genes (Hir3) n=1 Tax=Aspergillus affinis TaxID=1070780 RepID=UPI0022FE6435|nr:histone transcription regulator 3 [Aspergillus affinis]KAI9043663.1 histone transcription regulator 3 [Aspergillus affinis]